MTISITLDSSPRPKTMNRIGRIASGGTIDSTVSNGESGALNSGRVPATIPRHRPATAAMARPVPRRLRLEAVSCQNRKSPERLSGVKARRSTAALIWPKLGSNLSLGFSSRRWAELVRYSASSMAKGRIASANQPLRPGVRLIRRMGRYPVQRPRQQVEYCEVRVRQTPWRKAERRTAKPFRAGTWQTLQCWE